MELIPFSEPLMLPSSLLTRPSSSSSSLRCLHSLIRSSSFSTRPLSTTVRRTTPTDTESPSLSSLITPSLTDPRQRLFAVVHVGDRQWKVTDGDLIQLEGPSPLEVGDKIKLEKVLMVGSSSFSIFGRPLLDSTAVQVEAQVVERSHKYPELYYRRFNHQQTTITKWQTKETTTIRVTGVKANEGVLSDHSSEETKEAKRV